MYGISHPIGDSYGPISIQIITWQPGRRILVNQLTVIFKLLVLAAEACVQRPRLAF